jgi:hypothetical protein
VKTNNEPNTKRVEPTASAVLDDGTIVEMTFHPDLRATCFAIYAARRWTLQNMIDNGPDANLVPFAPNNNLIKNEVCFRASRGYTGAKRSL